MEERIYPYPTVPSATWQGGAYGSRLYHSGPWMAFVPVRWKVRRLISN